MDRRSFLATTAALPLVSTLPGVAHAQERTFAPAPAGWRSYEITTRLEVLNAGPGTQVWVPVPAIDTSWQQSLESRTSGNARSAMLVVDPSSGARMVHATFDDAERAPVIEVVSLFRAQNRRYDWSSAPTNPAPPADLGEYLKATSLIPTDGIVRATSEKIVAGKATDVDKARAIYEWVVQNTYREPKTRGCGVGDIKGMLETGNMGGKCADINAMFVGLSRAAQIPARDVYGIRVSKSAFDYKELGAGTPDITRAQHCRAEVWLAGRGWVAMDPADVGKVMRQETDAWIRTTDHPIVTPVYRSLWGGWEGNWLGYNFAHDIALPGSRGAKIGFLMYPQAETRGERVDSLDPDTFKYRITARELPA